jgi:hypothetical protein
MSWAARPLGPSIALTALALVLAGCAGAREAFSSPPPSQPSGREGWVIYALMALRFEAPAGWDPSGSSRHLKLEAPGGGARLEVSTPGAPFASEAACMADAEKVMKRGESMQRVRHHLTTFGGARSLFFEGDSAGWHVWAWAACDGGVQYQVFLTARSPAPPEVVEAYRSLTASARIGGEA